MATSSQAALLDQLMGRDRNSTRKREITWKDDLVCKEYLAGFCPHDLFVNTRLYLGPCTQIHDNNILANYKSSSSHLKMGYERQLQRLLQGYVRDIETKIKYNKERLEKGFLSNIEVIIETRIANQEKEITKLVEEIEKLGNEGRIEESQYLYIRLEELQKECNYDKIELERQKSESTNNQDIVCNVCGAYTNKNDLPNSTENHISGKIHSGYVKINEVLKELDEILKESEIEENRNRSSSSQEVEYNRHRRREESSSRSRKYKYQTYEDRDKSNNSVEQYHRRESDRKDRYRRRDRKEKRRSRSRSQDRSRNYSKNKSHHSEYR